MRGDQILQLPAEPLFWRRGGSDWATYTGYDPAVPVMLMESPNLPKEWRLRVIRDVTSDLGVAYHAGAVITAVSREIRGTWAECGPAYEASRAKFLAARAAREQARADREQVVLALQRLGYPTEGDHMIRLPIATVTALASAAATLQQLTTGEP
jgi:hypothetical protein